MAVPSSVIIRYNGQDITNKVIFSSARFEAQASAGIGTFQFTVKDVSRTLQFVTGKQIELLLDGRRYFAGPLMQVGHVFAFPAVNTTNLSQVTTRQFTLTGTNWNVLFDRRVTRNPANYYEFLEARPASTKAGTLLREFCSQYLDASDIDTTTFVDDIGVGAPGDEFLWKAQGTTWREQMDWLSMYNGALYYIDADKKLHYHSPNSLWSAWGFSDRPNNAPVPVTTATKFIGALYGFRELNTENDISQIVNDAFIWGGSQWSGEGDVVFYRAQNPTSISTNGRWQYAEPINPDLGIQEKVTERAKAIVGGPSSPYIGTDAASGLVRSQGTPAWNLSLTWFGHDVPTATNGTKVHLKPGDIVTIVLWVHGTGPTNPLILTLPLRSVSISFPTLPSGTTGNKTFVRFDGQFALSVNDPSTLWDAIRRRRSTVVNQIVGTTTTTEAQVPGAMWSGAPLEAIDGTRKTFTLMVGSAPVRYLAGTSEVYVNGLRFRQGADYNESPTAGTITFLTAPRAGSSIWVYVRMAA